MNERPSISLPDSTDKLHLTAAAIKLGYIKVRVLDWVLFTYFIMQLSLFPMFNGAALVNDKAAADPAVMAALSSLQERGWPSSSGLGAHYYVDSESITDPDELQEYWEEYQV